MVKCVGEWSMLDLVWSMLRLLKINCVGTWLVNVDPCVVNVWPTVGFVCRCVINGGPFVVTCVDDLSMLSLVCSTLVLFAVNCVAWSILSFL